MDIQGTQVYGLSLSEMSSKNCDFTEKGGERR
jgi:hypothetical protein